MLHPYHPTGSSFARIAFLLLLATPFTPHDARADDTAKIRTRAGHRPVKLWPLPEESESTRQPGRSITIGDWTYRATRARQVRDGVPWELIVTPAGEHADEWHPGSTARALPMAQAVRSPAKGSQQPESVPIIEIPKIVWQQRMDASLQDVVGIHFHELVTDDVARILYTLHKVPPDNPDGTPPAPGSYDGRPGTRIEATLLTPVVWSLDQSIAVRTDPLEKHLTDGRARHEAGHAGVSHQVLLDVLHGPQDWNPRYSTGQRSSLTYYWKRERIGRSWNGYQRGVGKLLTLRTSIVLLPPTRWSLLLPIPPERVTQKHIQAFNDSIVLLGPRFSMADKKAQSQFHAHHGSYENPNRP